MPTQMTNMIANTARPWRLSFTMRPKVKASANGMMRIAQVSTKLLNGVGFSNGWAELTLKKPPPLVPSCLMRSWLAAGPPGMSCSSAASTVWAAVKPSKFWITPWLTRTTANDERERQEDPRSCCG